MKLFRGLLFSVVALGVISLGTGCTQEQASAKKPANHFASRSMQTGSNIPHGPAYLDDNVNSNSDQAIQQMQMRSATATGGGGLTGSTR